MVIRLAILDGLEHTVINPVVNEIVKDINTRIIQDKNLFKYKESMYSDENVEVPDNVYDNGIGGSTLDINVETKDDDDLSTLLDVYKPINKILFLDSDLGLQIRTQYTATELTISLKYRTQSKTSALNVINRLKVLYKNSQFTFTHNLPYSFMLPKNVITLLENIDSLKDNLGVKEYIKSIANYKYELSTTRDNRYQVPTFRGSQFGVRGMFDNIPTELHESKESTPEYSLDLTYIVTIQKPLAVSIKYPILVNNKLIDKMWLPKSELAVVMDTEVSEFNIVDIIDTVINDPASSYDKLFKIPTYDTWVPDGLYVNLGKVRILSMLLEVNPDDLYSIFNINDLVHIGIEDKLLEYMRTKSGDELFVFGKSIFLFELYEVDDIKDYGLYMDVDYNIKTTKPLNIKKTYHIVMSVIANIDYLNGEDDDTLYDMYDYLNIRYTKTANRPYVTHINNT